MPQFERRRKSLVKPQSAWLSTYRRNVRSQFGEDGIIEEIFNRIGVTNSWCVEFGAWDGEYLSNTWNLLHNNGWHGILIEGDAQKASELQERLSGSNGRIQALNHFVGWAGDDSLENILKRTNLPPNFDLLSIDIDGNDWHVWNSLGYYVPRVVVIEFNPTIPNDIYFVQDADANISQGCSLLSLVELASLKGYELASTTDVNAIFVERSQFPKLGIEDNSIDSMHECVYDIEIFHGYDGTFYAAGHLWLNWHNVTLEQEDFQVLPKSMRRFTEREKNTTALDEALKGLHDKEEHIQKQARDIEALHRLLQERNN